MSLQLPYSTKSSTFVQATTLTKRLFKNSKDEQNEDDLTENITEQAVASTSAAMSLFQQIQETISEVLQDKE